MEIRSIDAVYNHKDNIIEGVAIVFNQESNILYDRDKKRYFREVIDANAITQELVDNCDIKFLYNHKKDNILARRKNGEGSLNIEVRNDGVYFSFECPDTTLGRDLKVSIERGDINTCSFAFTDDKVDWDFSNRETPLRRVLKVRELFDLSAVVDAAYSQTEISARSIDEMVNEREEKETETQVVEETKEEPKVEENKIAEWKLALDALRQRI